jgi:hypothetical protein
MARAEVFAPDEVAVVHRFYHNLLGTWFTTDPIGYQSGPNLFEYCQSLPQIAADPFGLNGRGLVIRKKPLPTLRDLKGVPLFGILKPGNKLVALSQLTKVNCLEFAINHDCAVYPLPDNSIKKVTDAFGCDCHANVSATNCQKKCKSCESNKNFIMIYIYRLMGSIFVRDPDKPNSWFNDTNLWDNNFTAHYDFHAIRGSNSFDFPSYDYQEHRAEKGAKDDTTGNPDTYTLTEQRPDYFPADLTFTKFSCCKRN